MNKKTMQTLFMASAFSALLILGACSKDDGGGNNNNNPSASGKAYFNLDGKIFVGANSPLLEVEDFDKDTVVYWTGKGNIVDTVIRVATAFPNFKTGAYTVDSIALLPGKIDISAQWGQELSSPVVQVTSGNCEMKRENNKWVVYLTNGKGKNTKNGRLYNNISMKFIYPF